MKNSDEGQTISLSGNTARSKVDRTILQIWGVSNIWTEAEEHG